MTDRILEKLTSWAASQPDIRAMLLTSTRAVEGATVDRYSDYDVILLTPNVEERYHHRDWLHAFGEVVIDYWDPLNRDDTPGHTRSTSGIVYYGGTLKIDFTLWHPDEASVIASATTLPAELDAGFRVLLDKDALVSQWPAATGVGYRTSLPTPDDYRKLVNDFFIGVPYVITALRRNELLQAKWVLDYDMRYVYLLPMLQWRATIASGVTIFGVNGKGLHRYLPPHLWQQLARTYADLDVDANCAALHAMISLFQEAACEVGEAIGASYPHELHDRVLGHIAALEADRD